MSRKNTAIILVIILSLIAIAIVIFPFIKFTKDFSDAVYYKDYTKVEKYLTGGNKIVIDGDSVSISIEDHPEHFPCPLYSNDRIYTRPKLMGGDVLDLYTLRLIYSSTVT